MYHLLTCLSILSCTCLSISFPPLPVDTEVQELVIILQYQRCPTASFVGVAHMCQDAALGDVLSPHLVHRAIATGS